MNQDEVTNLSSTHNNTKDLSIFRVLSYIFTLIENFDVMTLIVIQKERLLN
jgi:hypothetical protein